MADYAAPLQLCVPTKQVADDDRFEYEGNQKQACLRVEFHFDLLQQTL